MKKLLTVLFFVIPLHASLAFDENDHEDALKLNEAGKIVTLESILDQLHQRSSGRLLQVELHQQHGVPIYEVEVVDKDGLVWAYRFNATNGQFIDVTKDSD